MPRRARAPLAALVLVVAPVFLSSCAADDESAPTEPATATSSPSPSTSTTPSDEPDDASPSESPDDAGPEVAVRRQGGTFTPNGERIKLDIGQTLALTITADVAGELHVHSTPEQTIAYEAGSSEHEITVDRPGLVEVENHEPAVVVLQLEVR